MIAQLDAFDPAPPRFPRARRGDAVGSHDAAAAIEASGKARSDAKRVLDAVRRWPGRTSLELARHARIDRYDCGRRLPELASDLVSAVRRVEFSTTANPTDNTTPCAISGKRAIRWWPR